MPKLTLAISLVLISLASEAHAYIGPGLGAGAVAMVLGVVGSIFLALFAVLYYPIKRMMRRRKNQTQVDQDKAR